MKEIISKEYYTTKELADVPWFPIRSEATIRTLIENSKLKAVNVSAVEGKFRYKISKEAVLTYLTNLI